MIDALDAYDRDHVLIILSLLRQLSQTRTRIFLTSTDGDATLLRMECLARCIKPGDFRAEHKQRKPRDWCFLKTAEIEADYWLKTGFGL